MKKQELLDLINEEGFSLIRKYSNNYYLEKRINLTEDDFNKLHSDKSLNLYEDFTTKDDEDYDCETYFGLAPKLNIDFDKTDEEIVAELKEFISEKYKIHKYGKLYSSDDSSYIYYSKNGGRIVCCLLRDFYIKMLVEFKI